MHFYRKIIFNANNQINQITPIFIERVVIQKVIYDERHLKKSVGRHGSITTKMWTTVQILKIILYLLIQEYNETVG